MKIKQLINPVLITMAALVAFAGPVLPQRTSKAVMPLQSASVAPDVTVALTSVLSRACGAGIQTGTNLSNGNTTCP